MDLFTLLGGEPPTPEQRKAHALRMLRSRATTERMVEDAIPLLRAIRENLRELTKLGVEDARLTRTRQDMVTLVDDMQTFLVTPLPPDPPPDP